MDEPDVSTTTVAETANYMIWKAEEPDGEVTYHLELGPITLHFFEEEWEELQELMRSIS